MTLTSWVGFSDLGLKFTGGHLELIKDMLDWSPFYVRNKPEVIHAYTVLTPYNATEKVEFNRPHTCLLLISIMYF